MTGLRRSWLVARRELRERSRSRAFQLGSAVMLLAVVALIVVPPLVESDGGTKDVGVTGTTPHALVRTLSEQGEAAGVTVRAHFYEDVAAGEEAVRDQHVDVLVVDGRVLEWRDEPDEHLASVVAGSIQLVAIQERAAGSAIDPADLRALLAPVPVEQRELGLVEGRSADDETAAYVMSILLLIAIITYGNLVLTGVVEEKSSRVVEVLLARIPARHLLAGKVAGIGLLGLAQFAATAVAALVATLAVDSVDLPAVRGSVLGWVVLWFVLGYALYAMAYGALGSLSSRTEDASSAAGPITTLLLVGYWASYFAVVENPSSGWSTFVSVFPVTAPFAMPPRIALGAVEAWEPVLAVALAVAAVAVLVVVSGRVYTRAILHSGTALRLRDVWNGAAHTGTRAAAKSRDANADGFLMAAATGAGLAVGLTVGVLTSDVVLGVAAGAAAIALVTRGVRVRGRQDHRHARAR